MIIIIHIVFRLGIWWICDGFFGDHFLTHGNRAMAGAPRQYLRESGRCQLLLLFIDHGSMHTGRTTVGYWLMSSRLSVDIDLPTTLTPMLRTPIHIGHRTILKRCVKNGWAIMEISGDIGKTSHRKYIIYLIEKQCNWGIRRDSKCLSHPRWLRFASCR